MKQGAVIVAVWFALAAPAFSSSAWDPNPIYTLHVESPEVGTDISTVSIPYTVSVKNHTGSVQSYALQWFEWGEPLRYYGYFDIDANVISTGQNNSGTTRVFSGTRSIVRYPSIGTYDVLPLGEFDQVKHFGLSLTAVGSSDGAYRGRRVLWLYRFMVRASGSRIRGAQVLPSSVSGPGIDIHIDDDGYSFCPVAYSVGDGFARFFWGDHHIDVTGVGTFWAPLGESITALGGTSGTWIVGTPGRIEVDGSVPGGGDPPSVDFTPAVHALRALSFVVFGCGAGIVVSLGLRRLWTHL